MAGIRLGFWLARKGSGRKRAVLSVRGPVGLGRTRCGGVSAVRLNRDVSSTGRQKRIAKTPISHPMPVSGGAGLQCNPYNLALCSNRPRTGLQGEEEKSKNGWMSGEGGVTEREGRGKERRQGACADCSTQLPESLRIPLFWITICTISSPYSFCSSGRRRVE